MSRMVDYWMMSIGRVKVRVSETGVFRVEEDLRMVMVVRV